MHFATSFSIILTAVGPLVNAGTAAVGKADGFGWHATGGNGGQTVTPTTIQELTSYLKQAGKLNIVLDRTFDFRGTEGVASEVGCAPYGTAAACQIAINKDNWCNKDQPNAPKANVRYDKAAFNPLIISSDKTLVGVGKKGVLIGKGVRLPPGTNNVIVQNIEIRELNPQYVWGGDGVSLDGTSNVWIDHVKTSRIGRQHVVTGNGKNAGVTISNMYIDGVTDWSAKCNTYHYWGLYFTGTGDTITFRNNYVYHTSGRSFKLGGGAIVHAPNNYWYDNTDHAVEGVGDSYALVEGSVFQNVKTPVQDFAGHIYAPTTSDAACKSVFGRNCVANSYGSTPAITSTDQSPIAKIGRGPSGASAASSLANIATWAGNTLA